MQATGSERPSDLARILGLDAYESPRRVKRWLDGSNEPDYEATLNLLELVGMLRPPPQNHKRREWRQRADELRSLGQAVRSRLANQTQ